MEFLGFEQSDIMILDWVWKRACLPLSLSLQPSPPPSPDMSDVLQPGSCRILEEVKKPEKVPKIWFHMVWLEIESTFLSILTCFRKFYFTKKWFVERNLGAYQFWIIRSNKKCKSAIMIFSRFFFQLNLLLERTKSCLGERWLQLFPVVFVYKTCLKILKRWWIFKKYMWFYLINPHRIERILC